MDVNWAGLLVQFVIAAVVASYLWVLTRPPSIR